MTKKDLKTGMTVQMKSGEFGIILGNAVMCLTSGSISLDYYNNDMHTTTDDSWSIIKVYKEHADLGGGRLTWRLKNPERHLCGPLIWERKIKPIEMSIRDIENKLGIENLKIVKG